MALGALNASISVFNASDGLKFSLAVQAGVFINRHKGDKPYFPIFDRMGLLLEFYRKDW